MINLFLRETDRINSQLNSIVTSIDDMKQQIQAGFQNVQVEIQDLKLQQMALGNKLNDLRLEVYNSRGGETSTTTPAGCYANMNEHPVYKEFFRTISGNNANVTYELLEKKVRESGFSDHWSLAKVQAFQKTAKRLATQLVDEFKQLPNIDDESNWTDIPETKRNDAVQRFELLCSDYFPFEMFIGSWAAEGTLINDWNRIKRNIRNQKKKKQGS